MTVCDFSRLDAYLATIDLILSSGVGIMASLVPLGGKKDYFHEFRLKRQARQAERGDVPGGSAMPIAEAVIPLTTVPAAETTRPPNPKKRKEDHGKDCGKSSRCHGDRSSSGKSPKRGRLAGGSSSSDPDFLGHELNVAEKVTVKLNPYQQDAYLSVRPSQMHDAFMELCSRTLVLGKRMASDLMERDKNVAEVEGLRVKLDESASKLQSVLTENTTLSARS